MITAARVQSTPGISSNKTSLRRIGFELLLDALFQSRQVFFRRFESLQLKLQSETMVFFQLAFQSQLQFGNLLA